VTVRTSESKKVGVPESPNGVLVLSDRLKRAAVVDLLSARRFPVLAAANWSEVESALLPEAISVVVLEVAFAKKAEAGIQIRSIRARLPHVRLTVFCEAVESKFASSAIQQGADQCCPTPTDPVRIAAIFSSVPPMGKRSFDRRAGAGIPPPESPHAMLQPGSEDLLRWAGCIRQLLRTSFVQSLWALVEAVDAKDHSTRAHSVAVSVLAEVIGRRMRVSGPALREIRTAALVHDVGKIGIPDAILNKSGPLSRQELDVVRTHPAVGIQIVNGIGSFSAMKPLILHHHEWFDGGGYPAGLRRDQIPLGARILSVADAIETMFSSRAYKPVYSVERVRAELLAGTGRQFDPEVVGAAVQWLNESPCSSSAIVEKVGVTQFQDPPAVRSAKAESTPQSAE
jgi:HD-GYP domain-containing protein (c-di-GMP phosphodiesterase class II)